MNTHNLFRMFALTLFVKNMAISFLYIICKKKKKQQHSSFVRIVLSYCSCISFFTSLHLLSFKISIINQNAKVSHIELFKSKINKFCTSVVSRLYS